MPNIEEGVTQHYSAYDVLARIREGLRAAGHVGEQVPVEAIKPVDEFHIGGAEATAALLADLQIDARKDVLDIGCGIGGPARTMALRSGASVTGIDLTPAFIEAARALSQMTGMGDRVRFEVASATALPFEPASFDLATLLHVGMNIPDKSGLFREAARVLRHGGIFAVYDVMRVGPGELAFPVPWAERAELSALEPPETYRSAAAAAGLELTSETNRRDKALDFFARIQAQAAGGAAPNPNGLHLLLGPTVKQKTANMIEAIKAGIIAPVQMIFRKS
ncbi:MAG: class I SAM-dependent methyltransferase [Rhizobiaceae bacterium]